MRTWFREQRGGWATIEEFIATAERVSGQQLDDLFDTWLFTPEKPAGIETVERRPEHAGHAARGDARADDATADWLAAGPLLVRFGLD